MVMPARRGDFQLPIDTLPEGSRYASPTGSGDGLTAATPASLSDAIASATTGATVITAPGGYAGLGAINKRVDVRPPLGVLSNTTTKSSSTMYPGRGTLGSLTIDLYTASSLIAPVSGEYWMSVVPSSWRADGSKMGILYMHGATSNETQPLSAWPFSLGNIITAVVAAGYPVLCPFGGGDTWGNTLGQARMDEARTYLQGTLGAKPGKIGLIGGSMGGLSILNWARNHLTDVAVAVGITPVSDVTDIHTNNRSGLASSINGAYPAVWSEATYGASFNPHTYASSLTGLNYKAWYGASDTIVITTTVTDVVSSIGGTASAVSVTGDHTSALANIPPSDVVSFINAHAS